MPKNACKCCPIVKRNFRDHYTCHKSRPSVQKYGFFKIGITRMILLLKIQKNIMFVIPYFSNYVIKKFIKKYLKKVYQQFHSPEVKDLSKDKRCMNKC